MNLFDPTGDVDAERMAIAMTERPGFWVGDRDSDGRTLDQHDTDLLICSEVWLTRSLLEILDAAGAELRGALGEPYMIAMIIGRRKCRGTMQRGGIHSDPLVRMIAFRAWNRRDIDWHYPSSA